MRHGVGSVVILVKVYCYWGHRQRYYYTVAGTAVNNLITRDRRTNNREVRLSSLEVNPSRCILQKILLLEWSSCVLGVLYDYLYSPIIQPALIYNTAE